VRWFRSVRASALTIVAHLAVAELEAYFKFRDSPAKKFVPGVAHHANARWGMVAAA
jgi:hypothetical protein